MSIVRAARAPTPLVATSVTRCVPSAKSAVNPEIVAVPFPLLMSLRPAGKEPVSLRAGDGVPPSLMVKLPGPSAVKCAVASDEIAAATAILEIVIVVGGEETAL